MTPSALLLGCALIVLIPWLARPLPSPRPEIRGPIRILWCLNWLYTRFWHRLEIENAAPLPETGPAILISNHTCGIDHMILQSGTDRLLGFMIAQEFYDHKIYHPFCLAIGCIPVKRDGRDQTAIRAALRALKDGRVLPIFPEGRINPHSGRDFLEPKPGAAFIALKAGVPVIPAYICGTPATNDINAALATPSHARLVFGPPIDLSDLVERQSHGEEREHLAEATRRIMGAVKALRDQYGGPS